MSKYDRALRDVRRVVDDVAARAPVVHVDDVAWKVDLERYEAINNSLVAQPVRPGWFAVKGAWQVRGEYDDVPRRFLDLTRPASEQTALGNVDDRAGEFEALGIADGDDLVAWMQTAHRPRRAEYVREGAQAPNVGDIARVGALMAQRLGEPVSHESAADVFAMIADDPSAYPPIATGAERLASHRDRLVNTCVVKTCGNDARPGLSTCAPCNEAAKVRVKAWRAARKAASV